MLIGADQVATAALKGSGLLDDLNVASDFAPSVDFYVSYGDKQVSHGNTFTVEETAKAPSITLAPVDESERKSYTLFMVDPDVPSRTNPIRRSFNHATWTGLQPPSATSETPSMEVSFASGGGQTISYRPCGPPAGSGGHRYTFLLYEEPSGFSVKADEVHGGDSFEGRKAFDVSAWAKEKGLQLVGANFFVAHPPGEA